MTSLKILVLFRRHVKIPSLPVVVAHHLKKSCRIERLLACGGIIWIFFVLYD